MQGCVEEGERDGVEDNLGPVYYCCTCSYGSERAIFVHGHCFRGSRCGQEVALGGQLEEGFGLWSGARWLRQRNCVGIVTRLMRSCAALLAIRHGEEGMVEVPRGLSSSGRNFAQAVPGDRNVLPGVCFDSEQFRKLHFWFTDGLSAAVKMSFLPENWITLSIPFLLAAAWLYTAQMARTTLPVFKNKRICLLIAHPDDEAMFFSPTLTALTAPHLGNHVKILCLSSGDADGLGETRKKELAISGVSLGLRTASDVLVIEDEAFQDSMTATWSPEKIAHILSSAFVPNAPKPKKSNEPPSVNLDVLITFDKSGVSSHPNHISLYHGAKSWVSNLMKGKRGWKSPVELYSLTSVNVARKYIFFLDSTVSLLIGAIRGIKAGKKKMKEEPPTYIFISNFGEYRKGQKAMTEGHKSQMVWFRWGWIAIGRYMIVNDLKREAI